LSVCERLLIFAEKSLESTLNILFEILIVVKGRIASREKSLHWNKSRVENFPFSTRYLDHLFEAILVDYSKGVVGLPFEISDDLHGVEFRVLLIE
jgi:hypothetical protein